MTTVSGLPQRVLRLAALASGAIAVVALAVGGVLHAPQDGLMAAAGLGLGVANLAVVHRGLDLGLPVVASTPVRLILLSAAAAGGAVLFGMAAAIWLCLGVAAALVALSVSSLVLSLGAAA